ncbi:MAG TPA: glycosyltransferase family 2 protein, partial [Pyrinomonadaceae bacterium]
MLLSLVIPVFNEAQTVYVLISRIREVLRGFDWQVLFVNDGSTDETLTIIHRMALNDNRIQVLSFSRNFGHQSAVTAGLDFADGDAVIVMDGDLQDPPELLPEMVRLFEQGYDVVSPQRICRRGETWLKRSTAAVFYRLMSAMIDNRLTPDV